MKYVPEPIQIGWIKARYQQKKQVEHLLANYHSNFAYQRLNIGNYNEVNAKLTLKQNDPV